MTDLYPIVIPPFEHRFKAVTYTCSGEGLRKDGHSYDPNVEKFIPPKAQKLGNNIGARPAGWWKAQCAFRGLKQTGSIAELQSRLGGAKKEMDPELKAAESQLIKDFMKQNKLARDGDWDKLKTAEEKADANPQRYLNEAFPKSATGELAKPDIIIVKNEHKAALAEAAHKMGLESLLVDAPRVGNKRPSPDQWVVVGRITDAVLNQKRELERAATRPKENIPKKTPGDRPKQTARKSVPSSGTHDNAFDEIGTQQARPILPLPRRKQGARKIAPSAATHDNLFSDSDSHGPNLPGPALRGPKKQTAVKSTSSTSTDSDIFFDSNTENPESPGPVSPGPKKQTAVKSTRSTNTHPDLFVDDGEDEVAHRQPAAKRLRTSASGARANSSAAESEDLWDVRGSYVVECPDIEEEWGEKDSDLTLDIYVEKKNGRHQIFAMFNFIVVEGIMRFERPTGVPSPKNADKKRKRESTSSIDEDGDVMMSDVAQNVASNSKHKESAFFLGVNDKPTARCPTWPYRWRGEETGEGEIQVGSDKRLESITFDDKNKSLSGTFTCGFAGKCKFTGLKVNNRPHDSRIDPESQWESRSEAAYEETLQTRWK
ncbi:uncharacterized protein EAF02_010303 [Botrytis sinoallii]|uniref:uncharacterized protein n=1 Tax=Botrytis sinoallii TaxID=1463999 RepID=UPI001901C6F3|nr:uncharacterized protein EAF02_010303 [Botrytis sinoallii]KAF7864335.1 hypothetical protein EAF02_010303 [Botrytis sinoallii]